MREESIFTTTTTPTNKTKTNKQTNLSPYISRGSKYHNQYVDVPNHPQKVQALFQLLKEEGGDVRHLPSLPGRTLIASLY